MIYWLFKRYMKRFTAEFEAKYQAKFDDPLVSVEEKSNMRTNWYWMQVLMFGQEDKEQ